MSFGDQTVSIVTATLGAADRNGIPAETPTETVVSGCRFRPLRTSEKLGLTDISTEVWKLTAPPVAAVLNATTVNAIKYGSDTFLIVGEVQPFTDMSSTVHKVTVLCQKQT